MDPLSSWDADRRKTITELQNLGESIKFHARNAKIASAVGTGTGVISGVGAAICYLIAPLTAGASLIPAGVLTGVSITGGAASVGSSMINFLIERGYMNDVQAALDKDRKAFAALASAVENARRITLATGLGHAASIGRKIPTGINVGSQFIRNLSKSEKAAGVLIKLGKTARFAGHVVTFVVLPLDIIFFVQDAIDLAKGNVSAAADNVLKLVEDLQNEHSEIMSEAD